MMSNLSVRRGEEGGEEEGRREVGWFVRSLRADEIKRDDLAILASSASDDDDDVALTSVGGTIF